MAGRLSWVLIKCSFGGEMQFSAALSGVFIRLFSKDQCVVKDVAYFLDQLEPC
jgi:hypothetical protein